MFLHKHKINDKRVYVDNRPRIKDKHPSKIILIASAITKNIQLYAASCSIRDNKSAVMFSDPLTCLTSMS